MRRVEAWLVGLLLLQLAFVETVAAADSRRVFLLHSFGRNYGPWNAIAWQLREELANQATDSYAIDFYEASLDGERLGTIQDPQPFLVYVRSLFANHRPDLLITIGAPAARFLLQHRSEFFPFTPLLIAAADRRTFPESALSANDTAVTVSLDQRQQINNMLQLIPDLRHVAIVLGNSALEQFWINEQKRAFQDYDQRLTFEWLSNLSLQEILARVGRLPPHSAIYYGTVLIDARGNAYEGDRVLARLSQAANAPIFGFIDNTFGAGIVGGPMVATRTIARRSAAAALRLLKGEARIQVEAVEAETPRYDARELERWKISESRLPAGSHIAFQEPTAWRIYRVQILSIGAALLLQCGLIAWLIYEHRRRHLAEMQSRIMMSELTHMNRLATAGELSASIAHEINQPLTRVMANASAALRWLAEGRPDVPKIRELLGQIVSASDRAAAVVASTRGMFTKNEEARLPIDLKTLIRSVIGLVRHELDMNAIELKLDFPKARFVVCGDQIQLQQVLLNLVMNAIEAMQSRQVRVLKLRCEDGGSGRIAVAVEDTGSGIEPENLEKVFDPLFTTKPRGMGMGLSICRTIIENHDGVLGISPALSGGTIFRFELPIYSGDAGMRDAQAPRGRPAETTRPSEKVGQGTPAPDGSRRPSDTPSAA